ncbi:protein of unknown function [Bradyrhizobium vignae]|uniref:Uncharacterized protein n=1 Tax=Bradyrhizobium vignae TaxID=1549949 RepID=A0A2U3PW12_9BRAD|nr:protein of unknown function [Bradyrhizobium vignae]
MPTSNGNTTEELCDEHHRCKCIAERLRITPTPYHDDGIIDALAQALLDVWGRVELPLRHRALAAE